MHFSYSVVSGRTRWDTLGCLLNKLSCNVAMFVVKQGFVRIN